MDLDNVGEGCTLGDFRITTLIFPFQKVNADSVTSKSHDHVGIFLGERVEALF